MTIAFRGPTFMNVWGCPARRDVNRDDQLVALERVPLRADEELLERQPSRPAHARELDLGALDEERRQRVARGRGRPEVPADRPAVSYLRRADGARRLRERGVGIRELAQDLRVRERSAEA